MALSKTIHTHLAKWQDILRLRDWDIAVQIVDPPWRKSGDIKIDLDDRKAVLLVNRKGKCDNLEELVVHELLHLKLYDMDQLIEAQLEIIFGTDGEDPKRQFVFYLFMKALESTVEDLTKALLAANGCSEPLSFGRLRQQVEEELSNT